MAYQVLPEKCRKSGVCLSQCPVEAISQDATGRAIIDPAICTDCGTCSDMCPEGAVRGVAESDD